MVGRHQLIRVRIRSHGRPRQECNNHQSLKGTHQPALDAQRHQYDYVRRGAWMDQQITTKDEHDLNEAAPL
eukprot:238457-Amphidinium_carterae.1